MIRESSSRTEIQKEFIDNFVRSLPHDPNRRNQLIFQYQKKEGYPFLHPESKLYSYFLRQMNEQSFNNINNQMEIEKRIVMQGNAEQLSVGGMCQIIKERIRQGKNSYQALTNQSYLQEVTYTSDANLSEKINKIMHQINLQKLKDQPEEKKTVGSHKTEKSYKIDEIRKQMAVGSDGSLGAWGGKKYEGLGSRDEFSRFRREQSLSFYQNLGERKKL